ncbi:MAG: transcription elongation factor GreA [Candidatus Magasanikbacteria bacterium]|nr:transcription elongation factor GreA [Candidatus Magasanikbacteria bacterium]
MIPTQYLSAEKLDELKTELVFLKTNKMPKTAERIDEARQMGDLSENAEYHAAREELAWAQSRVKELEQIIDNASIVKSGGSQSGTVQMGSVITVKVNDKEKEYTIVGAQESNPAAGKISNDSPLAQAFWGKSKGDTVEFQAPMGKVLYQILAIN